MDGLVLLLPLLEGIGIAEALLLPVAIHAAGWTAGMIVRRADFGTIGNLAVGAAGLLAGSMLMAIAGGLLALLDLPALSVWIDLPLLFLVGPLVVAVPQRHRARG